MQRPRNGRRRHGQAVDVFSEIFYLFLMLHAEALLLVEHEKSEVLEFDVVR